MQPTAIDRDASGPDLARRRAVAAVLDTYRGYLRALARARVGTCPDAPERIDDLVQQTLLAALESLARGRLPQADALALKPWLRQILIHQEIRLRTHEGWHAPGLVEGRDGVPLDLLNRWPDEPTDCPLERCEQLDLIRNRWRRLSHRDRRLLLWRFGREWTLAQIGTRLGLTPPGVRKAIQTALRRLEAEPLRPGPPGRIEPGRSQTPAARALAHLAGAAGFPDESQEFSKERERKSRRHS